MMDCAASDVLPRRPAAKATISKAAHSVPTMSTPGRASFVKDKHPRKFKITRNWKPPHVLFFLCWDDRAV